MPLIPDLPHDRVSFTFYGKDKLLALMDYGENGLYQTCILLWTGIPLKPRLWATRELENQVHGHFLDEESSLLYVVYTGRIWARISLDPYASIDMDLHIASQTHPHPIRVEYCLSKNGKKLAVLKCWKNRAHVRVLDLDRPGQTLLCSSLDMPTIDIGTVNILFSPDVELLLVDNSLYRLDCGNRVDILVPMPMPSLFKLPKGGWDRPRMCVFSSSHDYVAIVLAGPLWGQAPMPHVYHISTDDGQITKLDIPIEHLEIFPESKITKIIPDFHPSQPKLGVAYWVLGAPDEQYIKFLVLNLQSMKCEHVQPSLHEQVPLVAGSRSDTSLPILAHFSSCGHYFMLSNYGQRHVFPLKCSQTDLKSPCKRPLIIHSDIGIGINCFFSICLLSNGTQGCLSPITVPTAFPLDRPISLNVLSSHGPVEQTTRGGDRWAATVNPLSTPIIPLLPKQPQNQDALVPDEEEWEIVRIVDKRWTENGYEYQVCWEKTWLLESELGNAQQLLQQFEAKHHAQRGGKRGRPLCIDKGQ